MLNNSHLINIDLTPEYRRNLKDLVKKYRNILILSLLLRIYKKVLF